VAERQRTNFRANIEPLEEVLAKIECRSTRELASALVDHAHVLATNFDLRHACHHSEFECGLIRHPAVLDRKAGHPTTSSPASESDHAWTKKRVSSTS
jgi:hypothetical protein